MDVNQFASIQFNFSHAKIALSLFDIKRRKFNVDMTGGCDQRDDETCAFAFKAYEGDLREPLRKTRADCTINLRGYIHAVANQLLLTQRTFKMRPECDTNIRIIPVRVMSMGFALLSMPNCLKRPATDSRIQLPFETVRCIHQQCKQSTVMTMIR